MDVIIPFKNEFPSLPIEKEAQELRFALRSIEKYLTGWNTVYLVTDNEPKWFKQSDKARVIIESDEPGRKEFSCYRKILKACDYVSVDFVYWNDDHFLTQPLDVSEIKNWHNGSLDDELYNDKHSARWRQAARNTMVIGYLRMFNADIHRPIVFNNKFFKQIFEHEKNELCIKSLYCHRCFVEPDMEFAEDCNITNNLTEEEIFKRIEGELFFSCKSGATFHLFNVLNKLYPQKSKFEA